MKILIEIYSERVKKKAFNSLFLYNIRMSLTLILFKERLIISEYDDFMQHLSIEKTRFL